MKTRNIRPIAAALSIILFATNCAFAHATETAFWAERRNALRQGTENSRRPLHVASLPAGLETNASQLVQQFPSPLRSALTRSKLAGALPRGIASLAAALVQAMPSAYGTVRTISYPSTSPQASARLKTILHIQDVHLNPEAQGNISKAIQSLVDQKKIDLVALEGAFGPMELSAVRKFPYPDSTKAVADYLFREKKISGAVYTAFTSPADIPAFVGVDDIRHYDANVEAYKQSAPLVTPYKNQLAELERKLNDKKHATFNKELAAFDAQVHAYRTSTLSWGDYVRVLAKRSATSTDTDIFLEALRQEAALDLPKVESERTQLITQLVRKLTKEQTSELINISVSYRAGGISHTDFYRYLKDLCVHERIPLNRYKAMDAYVQYVLLADTIDVEKILRDVDHMEKATYQALAHSTEEKRLVEASTKLHLTGKLLDFSLTSQEWKEYGETVHRLGTIDHGSNFSSFEKFYAEAEARDQAMTKNLLKAMERSHASVAVLVTGGFHAQGMDERLRQNGVATISYVPKITKVDDPTGSSYLSVFTQEKTPLDKLFAGEKLFVTPPVTVTFRSFADLRAAFLLAISSRDRRGVVTGEDHRTIVTAVDDKTIAKARVELLLWRRCLAGALALGTFAAGLALWIVSPTTEIVHYGAMSGHALFAWIPTSPVNAGLAVMGIGLILLLVVFRPVAPDGSETATGKAPAAKRNILVVENFPLWHDVLRRILEPLDVNVIFAADAITALALLGQTTFDGVLSDLNMPRMNGIKFFDKIKKDHPLIANRFAFLTTSPETVLATDFPADRIFDKKRLNIDGLTSLVSTWVTSDHAPAAPSSGAQTPGIPPGATALSLLFVLLSWIGAARAEAPAVPANAPAAVRVARAHHSNSSLTSVPMNWIPLALAPAAVAFLSSLTGVMSPGKKKALADVKAWAARRKAEYAPTFVARNFSEARLAYFPYTRFRTAFLYELFSADPDRQTVGDVLDRITNGMIDDLRYVGPKQVEQVMQWFEDGYAEYVRNPNNIPLDSPLSALEPFLPPQVYRSLVESGKFKRIRYLAGTTRQEIHLLPNLGEGTDNYNALDAALRQHVGRTFPEFEPSAKTPIGNVLPHLNPSLVAQIVARFPSLKNLLPLFLILFSWVGASRAEPPALPGNASPVFLAPLGGATQKDTNPADGARPALISVSGTLKKGEKLTIKGAGFGLKERDPENKDEKNPAAPLAFADFDSKQELSSVGIRKDWAKGDNMSIAAEGPNGTNVLKGDEGKGIWTRRIDRELKDGSVVIIGFRMKKNFSVEGNLKNFRVWPDSKKNIQYPNFYHSWSTTNDRKGEGRAYTEGKNESISSGDPGYYDKGVQADMSDWTDVRILFKTSDKDKKNGSYEEWHDGKPMSSGGIQTRSTKYDAVLKEIYPFHIVTANRDTWGKTAGKPWSNKNTVWVKDLYVDVTDDHEAKNPAFVVIGDKPTFAESRLSFQPTSTWNGNEITINVNPPAFDGKRYLYIVRTDGTVSAPFELKDGGEWKEPEQPKEPAPKSESTQKQNPPATAKQDGGSKPQERNPAPNAAPTEKPNDAGKPDTVSKNVFYAGMIAAAGIGAIAGGIIVVGAIWLLKKNRPTRGGRSTRAGLWLLPLVSILLAAGSSSAATVSSGAMAATPIFGKSILLILSVVVGISGVLMVTTHGAQDRAMMEEFKRWISQKQAESPPDFLELRLPFERMPFGRVRSAVRRYINGATFSDLFKAIIAGRLDHATNFGEGSVQELRQWIERENVAFLGYEPTAAGAPAPLVPLVQISIDDPLTSLAPFLPTKVYNALVRTNRFTTIRDLARTPKPLMRLIRGFGKDNPGSYLRVLNEALIRHVGEGFPDVQLSLDSSIATLFRYLSDPLKKRITVIFPELEERNTLLLLVIGGGLVLAAAMANGSGVASMAALACCVMPLGFGEKKIREAYRRQDRQAENPLRLLAQRMLRALRSSNPAEQILGGLSDVRILDIGRALKSSSGEEDVYARLGELIRKEARRKNIEPATLTPAQLASVLWTVNAELNGANPALSRYTGNAVLTLNPDDEQGWEAEALSMLNSNKRDTVLLVGNADQSEKINRLKAALDARYPTSRSRVVLSHDVFKDGKPNMDAVLPDVPKDVTAATLVFEGEGVEMSPATIEYYRTSGQHFEVMPLKNYLDGLMWTAASLDVAGQLQEYLKKLICA